MFISELQTHSKRHMEAYTVIDMPQKFTGVNDHGHVVTMNALCPDVLVAKVDVYTETPGSYGYVVIHHFNLTGLRLKKSCTLLKYHGSKICYGKNIADR